MSDLGPEQPPQAKSEPPQRIDGLALRQGDGFAPCPKCSQRNATKVGFTWWGGALGPRMFSVVKCVCGAQFNGKTGGSLTTTIIVYQLVAVVIVVVAYLLIMNR